MGTTKKHPRKRKSRKTGAAKSRRWSGNVTRNSNALDLDKGIFTLDDPEKIARSLNRSARRSTRKKAGSYRSAMSMLTFFINRAGKNLPAKRKGVLTKAKERLRDLHKKENGQEEN